MPQCKKASDPDDSAGSLQLVRVFEEQVKTDHSRNRHEYVPSPWYRTVEPREKKWFKKSRGQQAYAQEGKQFFHDLTALHAVGKNPSASSMPFFAMAYPIIPGLKKLIFCVATSLYTIITSFVFRLNFI
jgi:hypothetical protein